MRRTDSRLLARHEARSSLSDQVLISRYAWSDSQTRLAYRLNEETSWRFARPTQSFVVEKPGQPDALDGQVYAFAWRGDDELIACARKTAAADAPAGAGNTSLDAYTDDLFDLIHETRAASELAAHSFPWEKRFAAGD